MCFKEAVICEIQTNIYDIFFGTTSYWSYTNIESSQYIMQKIYLQLLVRRIWNGSTKLQNKCHLKCQWSYKYASDSVHFTVLVILNFFSFLFLCQCIAHCVFSLNQSWYILQTCNKFHLVEFPSLLSSSNFCLLISFSRR